MFLKRFIVICCLCIFGITPLSQAANPLETLKGPIEEVLRLLNEPLYHDATLKQEQRDKIWQTIQTVFNFKEVSKRTLARNWKKFSPKEQNEFVDVFSEFLGNIYVDKIQGEFHNEKIAYLNQKIVKKTRAMVRTNILRESLEIPVDYKMKLFGGEWKIYDVNIEGVSLVKNYRIQFKKILLKNSHQHLIEQIQKKLKKQKEKYAKGSK